MLDLSWYEGREQTYVKHVVLRNYLQKLAYKKGWHGGTINYVDCFAGPWQSTSTQLEDTSPFIAIQELSAARDKLDELGRHPNIRCLFIEKNKSSWEKLQERIQSTVQDIEVEALCGSFEDHIENICSFATASTNSFTFSFIDPTGWAGYSMDTIAPLLRLPGEVLINFMTQFIVRFIGNVRPEDIASFNQLFGSDDFRSQWADLEGLDREDAILRAYCNRVRQEGDFPFVSHTTILDRLSRRTHFNLIYATRSIEGLRVFRNDAERAANKEQPRASLQAQSVATGQGNLFPEPIGRTYSDEIRDRYQGQAKERMMAMLREREKVSFDDLEKRALLFPHMSTVALKNWLVELKKQNIVRFEGLDPKARKPQAGKGHHVILV